mmetsp:Transcript_19786/g.51643  ORF Transcript_19786/g.51643 Transcript_19786/m.51643 type:complete len:466 (-) Transcript_19786:140-1537(-)
MELDSQAPAPGGAATYPHSVAGQQVQAAPPRERAPHSATSACQLLPGRDEASSDSRYVVKARMSWLKAAEVATLLRLGFSGSLVQSGAPAQLPTGGSLYLYDRRRVRHFRADGHNWRKKSDGSAARETHEKLKVENIDTLNCYYARAMEPAGLQRRCYWLLEDESLVLVHYLLTGTSGRGLRDTNQRDSMDVSDHGVRDEDWRETIQMCLLADEPIGQQAWQELKRPHIELEGFGATMDALRVDSGIQQDSLQGSSRHSSLDEARDTFALPGAGWVEHHPVGRRWSSRSVTGHSAAPRTSELPWNAVDPLMSDNLLPWDNFPGSSIAQRPLPEVSRDQLFASDMDTDSVSVMSENSTHSGRPSMDEHHGARDSAHSPLTGLYNIVDISREVVPVHGGDKVMIVGNGCDLSGGVCVEVDGVACPAQVIQSGVISFLTQPHVAGIAHVVIGDATGMVISSGIVLRFV